MVLDARRLRNNAPLVWSCLLSIGIMASASPAADRRAESTEGEAAAAPTARHSVAELIRQLGSPRFNDRRAAAIALDKLGPAAFDQLQAATDASDPEVAASAHYLLRKIDVHWTQSDDSTAAARLLRDYGDLEEKVRLQRIESLARLPQREGVAGLCRIARFDRSPLVSRAAAAAVIGQPTRQSPSTLEAETFDRELGDSARTAAAWLRQYQRQLRDPVASAPGWQQLVDRELQVLDTNPEQTSPDTVNKLLWNLAGVYQQADDTDRLVETVDSTITVGGDETEQSVATALEWFVEQQAWEALDRFATSYDRRIHETKPAMYLLAAARERQGRLDEARRLADEAHQAPAHTDLESISAGRILTGLGHFDWAVREYRLVTAGTALESGQAARELLRQADEDSPQVIEAVAAATLLSSLLQDYEHFAESAAAIEPLAILLEEDREFAREYQRYQSILRQVNIYLLDTDAVQTRYHFMRAGYHQQQQQWAQQREQLRQAIGHDEEDADVLIAMYRHEHGDQQWRRETLRRIEQLSRQIEENIDENSDDFVAYNQWAWLIANTEGDQQKAVRYSQRSLELMPNYPSFLDTLGRCYFAVGEYEKAVEVQRRAVQQIPHMQVMLRQLAEFEAALAESAPAEPAPNEPK